MPLTHSRVSKACQRCRRQKLKCDVNRPCTLCLRAGTECVSVTPDIWKHDQRSRLSSRKGIRAGHSVDITATHPQRSHTQSVSVGEAHPNIHDHGHNSFEGSDGIDQASHNVQNVTAVPTSSSAIALIDEAFQYHDSTRPPELDTFAFRTSRTACISPVDPIWNDHAAKNSLRQRTSRRRGPASAKLSQTAVAEMLALLPPLEPAQILLDTYFDRVHWFLLLFHQDDFRQGFQRLFPDNTDEPQVQSLGFLSTVLAVCAVSLHYIGPHRTELLSKFNIIPSALKEQILEALGRRFLEIIALSSLEAVQTCVLLGTYYLFHGEPDLAWPICGCGLRIAQALGLHRKLDTNQSLSVQQSERRQRAIEAGKRCWWAIYEVETFCSMLYGLPLSISNRDCDVEYLSTDINTETQPGRSRTTMLAYKPLMSKMSVIIRSALTNLYGVKHNSRHNVSNITQAEYLRSVVLKIQDLDHQLQTWFEQLPKELRLHDLVHSESHVYSREELESTVGAEGPRFETFIFQLQALSLKLAYENARILLNRPLLGYKITNVPASEQSNNESSRTTDACQKSTRLCRDAALQISLVGLLPIYRLTCDTYAVSFVGTHLLTAGITLCIYASANPSNEESHEAKLGIHRLIQMQSLAQAKSIAAGQGLEILKRLAALLLQKELTSVVLSPIIPNRADTATHHDPGPTTAISTNGITVQNNNELTLNDMSQQLQMRDTDSVLQLPEQNLEVLSTGEIFHQDQTLDEDHNIMQAIMNFDQVTQPMYDELASDFCIPNGDFEHLFSNDITDQDQGWIWGLDILQKPTALCS